MTGLSRLLPCQRMPPLHPQLERRRLKSLSGELERALEEVRTRSEESEERRREAEGIKTEALAASKAAIREREAAQVQSARVEEVARRLEAERTSIAQASLLLDNTFVPSCGSLRLCLSSRPQGQNVFRVCAGCFPRQEPVCCSDRVVRGKIDVFIAQQRLHANSKVY